MASEKEEKILVVHFYASGYSNTHVSYPPPICGYEGPGYTCPQVVGQEGLTIYANEVVCEICAQHTDVALAFLSKRIIFSSREINPDAVNFKREKEE